MLILEFQGGRGGGGREEELKERAFIRISAASSAKTMLRNLIPLMFKFEEQKKKKKSAKWVLLSLNATELGLDRTGRKKIVYIEHTD